MDARNTIHILSCFVFGVIISANVCANQFYGDVAVASGQSDNGRKEEKNPLSERQDQYSLNVGGDWVNSVLAFNMGYGATEQTFSENSQEAKNYLVGSSSLLLGKETQQVNLLLEHSRMTLLNAPDSVNLTQNQEEKDVFSAKPTLRERITSVDNVLLNGEFTSTNYLKSDTKDLQRQGATLVWDHKLSRLDDLKFSMQQAAIDFKLSPLANYTYRSQGLTYSANLRKISYSAKAGFNQTLSETGKDYSSPSYSVGFAFNAGGESFTINADKELTDTSSESNSTLLKSDSLTSDGQSLVPNQIERRSVDASWTTLVLCSGCIMSIGASQSKDTYLNQGAEANVQGLNARFNYSISLASSISLQLTDSNNKFTETSIGSDFKMKFARLGYSYQVNRDFSVNCYVKKESRDGVAAGNTYTENFLGVSMNYKL